jgi:hypothetical protein
MKQGATNDPYIWPANNSVSRRICPHNRDNCMPASLRSADHPRRSVWEGSEGAHQGTQITGRAKEIRLPYIYAQAVTLPRKRKRLRSGIPRGPKRIWRRHEAWVRSLECAIPGCLRRDMEFAHLRNAANSGTGYKPASWYGVPLCKDCWLNGQMTEGHHAEAHRRGHDTVAAEHGINLWTIAAALARRSPDLAMRAAMQEADE